MQPEKVELESIEFPRAKELYNEFTSTFGDKPSVIIRVPGRVNIIGEHIDYCGYAVHPMAIDQDLMVAARVMDKSGLELRNVDKMYPEYRLDNLENIEVPSSSPSWWGYFLCGLKGVTQEAGVSSPRGLQVLVSGLIPPSAGLSSSSALVVSAALATVWANRVSITREQLASLCARSERFIGTQGGGMDQAIEILAEKGSAKLIEFEPLRTFNVTLPPGATFVVANTLEEKNKAASNDFNTRVVECRLATKVLAKKLLSGEEWREMRRLKDVQVKAGLELTKMEEKLDSLLHTEDYTVEEVVEILGIDTEYLKTNILTANTQEVQKFRLYQRAKHVYSEAARVYKFREICQTEGDAREKLVSLGKLMTASQKSCSELYECSSQGLDTITSLSQRHGAFGSRLTGAGWGGCMVALVSEAGAEAFMAAIRAEYYGARDIETRRVDTAIFVTKPGPGAAIMEIV